MFQDSASDEGSGGQLVEQRQADDAGVGGQDTGVGNLVACPKGRDLYLSFSVFFRTTKN